MLLAYPYIPELLAHTIRSRSYYKRTRKRIKREWLGGRGRERKREIEKERSIQGDSFKLSIFEYF